VKKFIEFLSRRSTVVFLSLAIQLAVLVAVLLAFSGFFYLFSAASLGLSVFVVVWILNDSKNSTFKTAWIILILVFPIFGGIFYLLFGRTRLALRMQRRLLKSASRVPDRRIDDSVSLNALEKDNPEAALQARYIAASSGTFLSQHSKAEYFNLGEAAYTAILKELESAKHFIFLEFFIIAEGRMWSSVLQVLERKAKAGVDVRVMYDDFGSMGRLPADYPRLLISKGIKCAVFNPFKPILSSIHNHRDHRKIILIDGITAFTGGINLADEYINEYERFGHWKDNALMIRGEAVENLNRMFLKLWLFAASDSGLPQPFIEPVEPAAKPENGYILPYEDNPLDSETVGINVYLNMITKAKRYLFITTPYLIIDESLSGALSLAAKSGVDVRIITPRIPDKWYVHMVSRSNYRVLLSAGVRIFEYEPGFIHSKTFIADDEYGVVGTINLDFRSFYLHFECGVWMYRCDAIGSMKDDFMSTLAHCIEIKKQDLDAEGRGKKALAYVLKLFSPLM